MFQLKLWYTDLLKRYSSLHDLEFALWGGFWSSDESWDIDLFLVPKSNREANAFPTDNLQFLEFAHDLISYGIDLAIDHYRFLIDITAATWNQLEVIARAYRDFSAGRIDAIDVDPRINCGMGIHSRVFKIRDGKLVFDNFRKYRREIVLPNNKRFYVKIGGPFDKQMQYIRDGRVYFEPTSLQDLFSNRLNTIA